jgi:hypothetical protein
MPEEATTPDRWLIVEYRTASPVKSQPIDGFATKGEALAWHRDFMGGDLRYVFVCEDIDEARAAAESLAEERG